MKKMSLLFLLFTLVNCSSGVRKFPEVKKLSNLKNTEFVTTLETEISAKTNAVYCATLLFAWREIKNTIHVPISVNDSFPNLSELNRSNSYKNVLKPEEFSASGTVDGNLVRAKASFEKSLPFEFKLKSFNDELVFNDSVHVSSFGVKGYNSEASKVIKITYYKNDENFIIELLPKNTDHQILLYKSSDKFNSMAEVLNEIKLNQLLGKKQMKSVKSSWKYFLGDEDDVIIPKFNFNLETNFTNLEGSKFQGNEMYYVVEEAYQSIAFLLDEEGAEIKSISEFELATEEIVEEEILLPKKMRFDGPFFIFLKRTDSVNPYFGMWISNAELLTKE